MGLVLIETICELPRPRAEQVTTALRRVRPCELPLLQMALVHGRVREDWRRELVLHRIAELTDELNASMPETTHGT